MQIVMEFMWQTVRSEVVMKYTYYISVSTWKIKERSMRKIIRLLVDLLINQLVFLFYSYIYEINMIHWLMMDDWFIDSLIFLCIILDDLSIHSKWTSFWRLSQNKIKPFSFIQILVVRVNDKNNDLSIKFPLHNPWLCC